MSVQDLSNFIAYMHNYYEILESAPSASTDELKANYRRLAMHWHPDRNPGKVEAEERFKLIAEAWATLGDSAKRRDYDTLLAMNSAGPGAYGTAGSAGFREGSRASAGGAWDGAAFHGAYASSRGPFGFAFSARDAEDLFSREMHALALELSLQNIPWQEIAQALESRGCPGEVARRIARKMEEERKAWVRSSAKPWFVRSAVSAFFGFSLFGLFGGAGFGILGLMGFVMLLSGGWNLARALYALATGNAPQRIG